RDVSGHEPDVERSIDVSGATMSLQVGDDDLVALREQRKDRPEHLARAESTVQQDERPPAPVDLVVEVDAVDLRVLARALRLCGPITGHGSCSLDERSGKVPAIETPAASRNHRP